MNTQEPGRLLSHFIFPTDKPAQTFTYNGKGGLDDFQITDLDKASMDVGSLCQSHIL